MGRIIFRRATWSTMRASCWASRTFMARSSGSTARRRCFSPPHGPCYRCLYPEPPPPDLVPNCAEGGVLGILPGLIGVVQATETVKLLLGAGRPLIGRLLLYDALDMTFREMKVRKNPRCPICGPNPTITRPDRLPGILRGPRAEPEPAAAATWRGDHAAGTQGPPGPRRRRWSSTFATPRRSRSAGSRLDRDSLAGVAEPAGELDRGGSPIVVHCKSGARSAKAIALLQAAGFTRLENLKEASSPGSRTSIPACRRIELKEGQPEGIRPPLASDPPGPRPGERPGAAPRIFPSAGALS